MSARQPAEWFTRPAAAEALRVSLATLDRFIKAGKITSKVEPRPGRRPEILISPQDVERMRPTAPATAGQLLAPSEAPAPAPHQAEVLQRIFAAIAPPAGPARYLTVKEAAAATGLSVTYIVRACKIGALPFIRDRGIKVKERDLSLL